MFHLLAAYVLHSSTGQFKSIATRTGNLQTGTVQKGNRGTGWVALVESTLFVVHDTREKL